MTQFDHLHKEFDKAYIIQVQKKNNWKSELENKLNHIANTHNIPEEDIKSRFDEYVKECKIQDFEKAYLIRLNKSNNWQVRLKYELLLIADKYNISSLKEIEKIFNQYYYDNNPSKDSMIQEGIYRLSCHSGKLWAVFLLLITFLGGVLPIWSFIAGVLESNDIAQKQSELEQEKQIKESFEVLSKYGTKSYAVGRDEALTLLNKSRECDNNNIENQPNKNIFNPFRSQKKCIARRRYRLDGVNLENAALIGINLDNGFLNYANFKNAKLDGSSFKKAQLKWSKFQGARIENAKFQGANLYKANFNFLPVKCEKTQKKDCKERTRLINADFSSEGENNTNLELAEFQDALLENAKFNNTNLKGVDFEWANLSGANLSGADLTKAKLPYTTLQGVKGITKEQVMKANNWDSAIYDDDFRKKSFCNQDKKVKFQALITLKGDGILNEYINNKDLQCFSFGQTEFLQVKDLTGVNFSNSNLTKANLQKATLKDINWTGTDLYCTDFRGTNLTRSSFEGVEGLKNLPTAIFDNQPIDEKCRK